MNADTRTHKKENAFSILLPTLDHLVVLILCGFGVYGEEGPRAVPEIRLPLQLLVWRRHMMVAAVIYYI